MAAITGQMGVECLHCKTLISMFEPVFISDGSGAMHRACAMELRQEKNCAFVACEGVVPKDTETCTLCGYNYGA